MVARTRECIFAELEGGARYSRQIKQCVQCFPCCSTAFIFSTLQSIHAVTCLCAGGTSGRPYGAAFRPGKCLLFCVCHIEHVVMAALSHTEPYTLSLQASPCSTRNTKIHFEEPATHALSHAHTHTRTYPSIPIHSPTLVNTNTDPPIPAPTDEQKCARDIQQECESDTHAHPGAQYAQHPSPPGS